MSLLKYIKDKISFLIYYSVLITFISIVFFVSNLQQDKLSNVIYINLIGLIFTSIYIINEYIKKVKFYREIEEVRDSNKIDLINLSSKPVDNESKLFIAIFKSLQNQSKLNARKLQQERKEYQDFIMSWVHEIKLPIATTKLILSNSDGRSVDYLVNKIEDEIIKIDNYVEQALYYSRIDDFSNDYFIEEIELGRVIKNSIKKYSKIFIDKYIKVFTFEEKYYVNTDSKWLSYIIDQIVYNSLKYTDKEGSIKIEYDENNSEKKLIIEDNGIGIKDEDINRVFEKGFTGNTGRNNYKSTGMGLYLAKEMAIKLGHEISIESQEGVYTRTIIHFPKIRVY